MALDSLKVLLTGMPAGEELLHWAQNVKGVDNLDFIIPGNHRAHRRLMDELLKERPTGFYSWRLCFICDDPSAVEYDVEAEFEYLKFLEGDDTMEATSERIKPKTPTVVITNGPYPESWVDDTVFVKTQIKISGPEARGPDRSLRNLGVLNISRGGMSREERDPAVFAITDCGQALDLWKSQIDKAWPHLGLANHIQAKQLLNHAREQVGDVHGMGGVVAATAPAFLLMMQNDTERRVWRDIYTRLVDGYVGPVFFIKYAKAWNSALHMVGWDFCEGMVEPGGASVMLSAGTERLVGYPDVPADPESVKDWLQGTAVHGFKGQEHMWLADFRDGLSAVLAKVETVQPGYLLGIEDWVLSGDLLGGGGAGVAGETVKSSDGPLRRTKTTVYSAMSVSEILSKGLSGGVTKLTTFPKPDELRYDNRLITNVDMPGYVSMAYLLYMIKSCMSSALTPLLESVPEQAEREIDFLMSLSDGAVSCPYDSSQFDHQVQLEEIEIFLQLAVYRLKMSVEARFHSDLDRALSAATSTLYKMEIFLGKESLGWCTKGMPSGLPITAVGDTFVGIGWWAALSIQAKRVGVMLPLVYDVWTPDWSFGDDQLKLFPMVAGGGVQYAIGWVLIMALGGIKANATKFSNFIGKGDFLKRVMSAGVSAGLPLRPVAGLVLRKPGASDPLSVEAVRQRVSVFAQIVGRWLARSGSTKMLPHWDQALRIDVERRLQGAADNTSGLWNGDRFTDAGWALFKKTPASLGGLGIEVYEFGDLVTMESVSRSVNAHPRYRGQRLQVEAAEAAGLRGFQAVEIGEQAFADRVRKETKVEESLTISRAPPRKRDAFDFVLGKDWDVLHLMRQDTRVFPAPIWRADVPKMVRNSIVSDILRRSREYRSGTRSLFIIEQLKQWLLPDSIAVADRMDRSVLVDWLLGDVEVVAPLVLGVWMPWASALTEFVFNQELRKYRLGGRITSGQVRKAGLRAELFARQFLMTQGGPRLGP